MAQLANDPNQANMAQQTLLLLEATGYVPVYYRGVALPLVGTVISL